MQNVAKYLRNVEGFKKENVTILMDDGVHKAPTKSAILSAYKKLVRESKEGDVVFCHYSGNFFVSILCLVCSIVTCRFCFFVNGKLLVFQLQCKGFSFFFRVFSGSFSSHYWQSWSLILRARDKKLDCDSVAGNFLLILLTCYEFRGVVLYFLLLLTGFFLLCIVANSPCF